MSDPYFHFRFETGDVKGTSLYNYGSSAEPATLSSTGLITTTSPLVDTSSLQLSAASSQYVTLPTYTIGPLGITFCVKFKSNSTSSNGPLFDISTAYKTLPVGTTQYTFQAVINSSGGITISYIINGPSSIGYSEVYSTNLNNNVEHSMCWTISAGGTMKMYIDSVLQITASMPYPTSGLEMPVGFIGRSTYSSGYPYFNGTIDDFRVYNHLLAETEIVNYHLAKNTLLQVTNTQVLFNDNSYMNSTNTFLFPIDSVVMWSGPQSSIPTGWYICDGTNGTIDLTGRMVVGRSTDASFNSLGNTGGEKQHTLTIAEMPSHSHTLPDTINFKSTTQNMTGGGTLSFNTQLQITTDSTGNNAPHNNMPPYYVLYFIQRKS